MEDDGAVDEGAEEEELDDDVDDQAEHVGTVEGGVGDADGEEGRPGEELEQVRDEVLGGREVVAGEEDDLGQAEEEAEEGDGEDDGVEALGWGLVRRF